MFECIKTVNDLPHPPHELLDDIPTIIQTRKNMHFDIHSKVYGSYTTNPDLESFYQQYFDNEIVCRYQLINDELPIHIDGGLEDQWKYNYLLDTGGQVYTSFWTSVNDSPQLVYRTICEPLTWYHLNVSMPHSISKPDSTRFSLVIRNK